MVVADPHRDRRDPKLEGLALCPDGAGLGRLGQPLRLPRERLVMGVVTVHHR